jgi:predicted  nucleic acid-binding Zn-ribbon protein
VHLHGDQGEARRRSVADSNECHHLRSRMLELQRSNYRLESDLMDAKRASQAKEDTLAADKSALNVDQLQQENHSLKQIITMMRKEMEQLSPEDKSNDDEAVPSSYILALEHQLVQSRAYLDILLKSRDFRSRAGGEDELHFLRTRYRELHEVLDQVRDENLR